MVNFVLNICYLVDIISSLDFKEIILKCEFWIVVYYNVVKSKVVELWFKWISIWENSILKYVSNFLIFIKCIGKMKIEFVFNVIF